jgi:N-acyl-D-amino-acid deacylase
MSPTLDLLIENATVYDGESPAPRRWRVGVAGDRIALVEEASSPAPAAGAREVVDARGLVLCPGFIDTHASTGFGYRLPHAADHKLWQGVTTEVIGNCGTSSAPIGEPLLERTRELAEQAGFPFDWRTLDEWLRSVEAYGLPIHSATYVGHGTVRASVAGDARQVTEEDLAAMEREVEAAMRAGALGLSTGLVYAPGSFADTAEVIRLARVAARHGGRYASHIRNEREGLEAAVAEVIEISRRAGLPALVSHLKAAERPNWGKIPAVIDSIERARGEGVDVTFEVYPYAAVSTQLRTFIPKETLAGGVEAMIERLANPEWRARTVAWLDQRGTDYAAMVMITESLAGSRGASVAELAKRRAEAPGEMVIELLLADPAAWIVYHCIDEADLDAAVSWPDSIVCSDSWSYPVNAPYQIGDPHPRTFGAFTRFLERWALSDERMPLGAAIRKITSLPADFLGFADRGRIRQGCMADLVLLDPGAVAERATYSAPRQFSAGTVGVWVHGTRMLGEGGLCVAKPGRILRSGHDQATNS